MDRNRAIYVGMASVGLLAAAVVIRKLTGRINPLHNPDKAPPDEQQTPRRATSHARRSHNGTVAKRKPATRKA